MRKMKETMKPEFYQSDELRELCQEFQDEGTKFRLSKVQYEQYFHILSQAPPVNEKQKVHLLSEKQMMEDRQVSGFANSSTILIPHLTEDPGLGFVVPSQDCEALYNLTAS